MKMRLTDQHHPNQRAKEFRRDSFPKENQVVICRQKHSMSIACLKEHPRILPCRTPPPPPPLPARLEPLCLLIGPVSFILPKIFLTCAALGNSMFPEQALHMHVSSLIFCSFLFLVCLGSSRHLPGPSPGVNLTSPYPLHTPIFPPPLSHRSFGIIVKLYSN